MERVLITIRDEVVYFRFYSDSWGSLHPQDGGCPFACSKPKISGVVCGLVGDGHLAEGWRCGRIGYLSGVTGD